MENRDLVLLGDANFCSISCADPDYPVDLRAIANIATDFYTEESLSQLIDKPTRTELRGNNIQKSCIDHITTNAANKCTSVTVIAAGNSDHLAVSTKKLAKVKATKPDVIKKRTYKTFKPQDFLREVKYTDFSSVISEQNEHVAAQNFSRIFHNILDNHAPIRVFQSRKHYAAWVSDETKILITERNSLKLQSTTSNDPEVLRNCKKLRNKIKAGLPSEK